MAAKKTLVKRNKKSISFNFYYIFRFIVEFFKLLVNLYSFQYIGTFYLEYCRSYVNNDSCCKSGNCAIAGGDCDYHSDCAGAISSFSNFIQGVPKKSLWCDIDEKCLWNSKIFFDGVFLYTYSHLLKKLELS